MGKHIKNFLFFLAVFLILNSIFTAFFGPEQQQVDTKSGLTVETTENEYNRNYTVALELKNNTPNELEFANDCPGEPFRVVEYVNGEWVEHTSTPEIPCEGPETFKIASGNSMTVEYTDWNYSLFSGLGRFKIEVPVMIDGEEKIYTSNEFTVIEEGLFGMIWNKLFYGPIYNILIWFISLMPGLNLGWAIILLTILIRTVLLIPSQKALRSQRKLQQVQPQLDAIKKKYAGDQQKIAQETMAIWKTQKVNPFGSCMPLLIQFPVLIALFYAVQSGLRPDSAYLLYEPIKAFPFHQVNSNFLGILELTEINFYVLPLIVGGFQFIQMKLSMSFKSKKGKKNEPKNEIQKATNMMIYFMPVMIAVFTASLPAGVGLYWVTSTIYGIIQQLFINREKPGKTEKPEDKNSPDVKVKVIDKN